MDMYRAVFLSRTVTTFFTLISCDRFATPVTKYALHEFIRKSGGWLVSAPHEKYLRVEVERGSPLPTKLTELGYDVRAAGVSTRVTSNGFMPTEIISFALPK
jgi:hypothetical protein